MAKEKERTPTTTTTLRLSSDLLRTVDAYAVVIAKQTKLPHVSRTHAVEQLLRKALNAHIREEMGPIPAANDVDDSTLIKVG